MFLLSLLTWGLSIGFYRWVLSRRAAPVQGTPWPERLGVHAATGLVLALATLVFVVLARQVVAHAALASFDADLAAAFRQASEHGTRRFFKVVTQIGSGWFIGLTGCLVAILLVRRGDRVLATGLVVALLGGGVLNQALKAIFQRARPEFSSIQRSWSFPSGHAMESLVAGGMFWYLATRTLPPRTARLIGALMLLLVLFIGLSRIYLGVHFFSDVVAGYAAGLVWLAVCISMTEIARDRGLSFPP